MMLQVQHEKDIEERNDQSRGPSEAERLHAGGMQEVSLGVGRQGPAKGSLRQRLLTWQCGAQEARKLCLPQAIGGLGSRNGASLIQTFLLSLSKTLPR